MLRSILLPWSILLLLLLLWRKRGWLRRRLRPERRLLAWLLRWTCLLQLPPVPMEHGRQHGGVEDVQDAVGHRRTGTARPCGTQARRSVVACRRHACRRLTILA